MNVLEEEKSSPAQIDQNVATPYISSGNDDQDELTFGDKRDLFMDFLNTDEWILPIESFITNYCLVFSTDDPKESFAEKNQIYDEYKRIMTENLDKFLNGVLGMTRENLPELLEDYDGDDEELEYLLALQAYEIFHNFMHEENKNQIQQAQRREERRQYPQQQGPNHDKMLSKAMQTSRTEAQKAQ